MAQGLEKDKRTFETRLQFINEISSNPYTKEEIMIKCINHKLKVSYENYAYELKRLVEHIENMDITSTAEILEKLK